LAGVGRSAGGVNGAGCWAQALASNTPRTNKQRLRTVMVGLF